MQMFTERLICLLFYSFKGVATWPVWVLLALCACVVTSQRGGWKHLRRSAPWALVFGSGLLMIVVYGAMFWGQGRSAGSWLEYCFVSLLILNAIYAVLFIAFGSGWRRTRLSVLLPWLVLTLTAYLYSALAIGGEFVE